MPHQRKAIPIEDLDPELTDVSRQVIGASIEVHKTLGPGFDRSVYVNALTSEMDAMNISYEKDYAFTVMYKGQSVGKATIGLYVNNRFAVEPLAEHREIDGLDRTALRAKLRAADLELGLIINFAERRLKDGLVRVLNPDKLNAERAAAAPPAATQEVSTSEESPPIVTTEEASTPAESSPPESE